VRSEFECLCVAAPSIGCHETLPEVLYGNGLMSVSPLALAKSPTFRVARS